ncbi:hypothetical protein EYF80_066844 [Liparis tanakae]|uniref:Uncharacterized protein n=1 Tax=Liparis tanakae TaxID=230148 RepID=A0A4Z2E2V1_9TELE|nr:hypothetical protein EYF80_066844 [Liparis tanakae]
MWRRASTAVASNRWSPASPVALLVSTTAPVCPVQRRSRNMLERFSTLSEGSDSFSALLK